MTVIYSAELVAVAGDTSKKSEIFQNGNWSDIDEPPVGGTTWYQYAVIFHGSSHYYFGGTSAGFLSSILRLQSGSWKWSDAGKMKSARSGHAVILVEGKIMVFGGFDYKKNEACIQNNGKFICEYLSSSLNNYVFYPILFSVTDNYAIC